VSKKELFGSDLMLCKTIAGVDLAIDGDRGDIMLVSEELNLSQAIQHRLKTGIGELAEIGYPKYGSNIYDLIGEPNNELTRTRLVSVIRHILNQESRIKEIRKIIIRASSREKVNHASIFKNKEVDNLAAIECADKRMEQVEKFDDLNNTSFLDVVEIQIFVVPIGTKDIINIEFPFRLDVT
jgi:phage baseplate assembly protein W